ARRGRGGDASGRMMLRLADIRCQSLRHSTEPLLIDRIDPQLEHTSHRLSTLLRHPPQSVASRPAPGLRVSKRTAVARCDECTGGNPHAACPNDIGASCPTTRTAHIHSTDLP